MPSSVRNDRTHKQTFIEWFVRTAVFVVFYAGQAVLLNMSQFLGLFIYPFSASLFREYITYSQRCFGVLLVAINQFFAQSHFVITSDASIKDLIQQPGWNGSRLGLKFPKRTILISNHQIYADWLYIWSFLYLGNVHGSIKIILKDSLKWMPVFGWGMQFFRFIFLKRSWAADRENLDRMMGELAVSKDPLVLLIFPEGTLVSESTKKISQSYADKNGLVEPKHMILPRSTGLHLCMEKLQKSVDYVYDLTVGYDGIKAGQYPEDHYTLRSIYFEGRYPRNIHVHVRRFAIADIPQSEAKFAEWMRQRWAEKDALMSEFYAKGNFASAANGPPATIPISMGSFLELAQIWLYFIPFVMLYWVGYWILNTYDFQWAMPQL